MIDSRVKEKTMKNKSNVPDMDTITIQYYRKWLAEEQLKDTPEHREAFKAGWERCKEDFQTYFLRIYSSLKQ
jgi:hypothetical protein